MKCPYQRNSLVIPEIDDYGRPTQTLQVNQFADCLEEQCPLYLPKNIERPCVRARTEYLQMLDIEP